MMGIFALEPCQIYFLHLPVDSQFLVVACSYCHRCTLKPGEIRLCETEPAKVFLEAVTSLLFMTNM